MNTNIPLEVLVAIACGGASMFSSNEQNDVGILARSLQVKEMLANKKLDVKIENIGGTKLRTMILNVDEGK